MSSLSNLNQLSSIAETGIVFSINEIDPIPKAEKKQVRFFPPDLLPPSVLNPIPKSALRPIIQSQQQEQQLQQQQEQQLQQQQLQQRQLQQRQLQQRQINRSSTVRQSMQTTHFGWKMNFR
jgi:hypothetical protein